MEEYCIVIKDTDLVVIGFVKNKKSNYIAEKYGSNFIQGWKCYKVNDLFWKIKKNRVINENAYRAVIRNNVFTDGIDIDKNGDLQSNVRFYKSSWEIITIQELKMRSKRLRSD